MSNISTSIVSMLYNFQLMKYAGENGIAAYGVLMYVNMIFLAIFIGYSTGVAPIVGYHYGAENHSELKGLLKKSYVIIGAFAVVMFGLAELLARPLAGIFVGYDAELMELSLIHILTVKPERQRLILSLTVPESRFWRDRSLKPVTN